MRRPVNSQRKFAYGNKTRPGRWCRIPLGLLFEEVHLRRFFTHFGIDCVFDVGAMPGNMRKCCERGSAIAGRSSPSSRSPSLPLFCARWLRGPRTGSSRMVALDCEMRKTALNVMVSDQFGSLRAPSRTDVDIFREANSVARKIDVTTSPSTCSTGNISASSASAALISSSTPRAMMWPWSAARAESIRAFTRQQSELAIRKLYDGAHDFRSALEYCRSKGFELSAFVPNNAGHFPTLVEIDCVMYRRAPPPP